MNTTIQANTTKDEQARRAALSMLSEGLASLSEVARLAGVSRQLMSHWAKDIDVDRARNGYLSKEWRKALKRR